MLVGDARTTTCHRESTTSGEVIEAQYIGSYGYQMPCTPSETGEALISSVKASLVRRLECDICPMLRSSLSTICSAGKRAPKRSVISASCWRRTFLSSGISSTPPPCIRYPSISSTKD
jgi:hypothetical protein